MKSKYRLGDGLFLQMELARFHIFSEAETVEHTLRAFKNELKRLEENKNERIRINLPAGFSIRGAITPKSATVPKWVLEYEYDRMIKHELTKNGIYHLVTAMESAFADVLEAVLRVYPSKIQSKRKIEYEDVMACTSVDEIRHRFSETVVHELGYKSPRDFAIEFKNYVGIDLLTYPEFSLYQEMKATRDIYIHNGGRVNARYLAKSGTNARKKNGKYLMISHAYFKRSYENCMALLNRLQQDLKNIWPVEKKESTYYMTPMLLDDLE